MLIGVPKEIKNNEYRVGITPAGVLELVSAGHQVYIETKAGLAIGLTDLLYQQAGAGIIDTAEQIYAEAELIVKVKEPQQSEYELLRPGQIIFTFLHLAADKKLTDALIGSGATCIAYETVTDKKGALPLLTPMSEVAGRMSIQVASHAMENSRGGPGILLGGVPGVASANVVVLGGGIVGENAARMAIGTGANTTVIDKSLFKLRQLDAHFGPGLKTLYAAKDTINRAISHADLIIGAVLVPGAKAPKLITRDMLGNLKQSAVLVDVAIDQGGCFETSRPTTHQNSTYIEEGIIHYCVTNIPGAVARTSTFALTNATLPYILQLAENGLEQAFKNDGGFKQGLNIHHGKVTYPAVIEAYSDD